VVAIGSLAIAGAVLSLQRFMPDQSMAPATEMADATTVPRSTPAALQPPSATPEPTRSTAVVAPQPVVQAKPLALRQQPLAQAQAQAQSTTSEPASKAQMQDKDASRPPAPAPSVPRDAVETGKLSMKQVSLVEPPAHAQPATSPARLLADFNAAMSDNRLSQASQMLEQSRATLGESHLLVARMEGYYGLQTGNSEQARRAYASILARLPSDREAGYNLVILDWKSGAHNQARERLASMLVLAPDDQRLHDLQTVMEGRR